MKKTYVKPEAKKVNFQYSNVLAASGYCRQSWSDITVLIPWNDECAKCYENLEWIHSTAPGQ